MKSDFQFRSTDEILAGLRLRSHDQAALFEQARAVRDERFHGKVEVRSVVEYSNICEQGCLFCGMCAGSGLQRYVLRDEVVAERVGAMYDQGRRIVMIQTGEYSNDVYFNKLAAILQKLKSDFPDIVLTLSLGCLSEDKYRELKRIGAMRYLLKFETSEPDLYHSIKPTDTLENRLRHIHVLKELGFHVSSGNITGLPGQTMESLAQDLATLKEMALPMGSTSPFIHNALSAFAGEPMAGLDLTLNFMAILRILCPSMVIAAPTSLELISRDGQYRGLMAGANAVTLHDGTPEKEENCFVIYDKNRYKPKQGLFEIVERAGLECSNLSLIPGLD